MSYIYTQLPIICDCFETTLPTCVDSITIPINLSDVDIMVYLKDKFGHEYLFATNSDQDGYLTIDLTQYPAGMFNKDAGQFLLSISLLNDAKSERQYFRTRYGYYPCLKINVVSTFYVNTTAYTNYILDMDKFVCCCSETQRTPCENLFLPNCNEWNG